MTTDTFTCVRVEGSILPTDLLQRVETALTFCVDAAGRAFDPARPGRPLLPDR